MAVPPYPVRVPSQWPLAPMLCQSCLSANVKSDNETKSGAVHRSGTYLMAEENPGNSARKSSDEGCAICHHLKWSPLPPTDIGRITQHIRKREGEKEGRKDNVHHHGLYPLSYIICQFHILVFEGIFPFRFTTRHWHQILSKFQI